MFVYKRYEYPIDIKLLLYYGPYERRVGIFTDSMFAIIVGFDVKGHRATSPLVKILGDPNLSPANFPETPPEYRRKALAQPLVGI
jgi:hypothetical protein